MRAIPCQAGARSGFCAPFRPASRRRAPTFLLTPEGIVNEARFIASPNYDDRPDPTDISLIVIHNISLPPNRFNGNAVARLFTNTLNTRAHPFFATLKDLRVSSHFWIRRHGALIQFVPTLYRAWHAGASVWQGKTRCNDFSIGIELEGADTLPYRAAQYKTLNRLIDALVARYPITAITGHSAIAPDRKTDPGEAFLWRALHLRRRYCLVDGSIFIKR